MIRTVKIEIKEDVWVKFKMLCVRDEVSIQEMLGIVVHDYVKSESTDYRLQQKEGEKIHE